MSTRLDLAQFCSPTSKSYTPLYQIYVSIVDLLHHSVCIVVLVSNSPPVPASQEAVVLYSCTCSFMYVGIDENPLSETADNLKQ